MQVKIPNFSIGISKEAPGVGASAYVLLYALKPHPQPTEANKEQNPVQRLGLVFRAKDFFWLRGIAAARSGDSFTL